MKNVITFTLLFIIFGAAAIAQQGTIQLLPQTGHAAPVKCLSVDADGNKVASLDQNGNILIWDLLQARQLYAYDSGDDGKYSQVAMHPHRTEIYLLGMDAIVCMNFETGEQKWVLPLQQAPHVLSLSENGFLLAVGIGRQIWVVEALSGTILKRMQDRKKQPYSERVEALQFSQLGDTLYSGHNDGTVRQWESRKGRLLNKRVFQNGQISALALHATGSLLAVTDNSEKIVLWDTRNLKTVREFSARYSFPESLAFHPTEPWLLLGINEGLEVDLGYNEQAFSTGIIEAWDFEQGELVWEHRQDGGIKELICIPNSQLFLTGDRLWQLNLRRLSDGIQVRRLEGLTARINELLAIPNSSLVVQADNSSYLKVWDLSTGSIQSSLFLGDHNRATALAIDTVRNMMAVGMDNRVSLWKIAENFQITEKLYEVAANPTGIINKIFFLQNSERLVISGSDMSQSILDIAEFSSNENNLFLSPELQAPAFIKILEIKTGNEMATFEGYQHGTGNEVAIHPVNDLMAIAQKIGSETVVEHWSLINDQQLGTITNAHQNTVTVGRFSPDGSRILTGGYDPNFLIWDLEQTQYVTLGDYPNSYLLDAAFSPDNALVAIAENNLLQIWDIEEKKPVKQYINSCNIVKVTFSADGAMLIAGDERGEMIWWSTRQAKPTTFAAAVGQEGYLVYTPEKYYLASREAVKSMSFAVGQKNYAFEQFDALLNKPHFVLANLPYADPQLIHRNKKAYEKRLETLAIKDTVIDFTNLPLLKIEQKSLPVETLQTHLLLPIEAWASTGRLSRLHSWINGVPLFGRAGMQLSGTNYRGEISIPLASGDNLLEFAVEDDKGRRSSSLSFRTFCSVEAVEKNTYVIGIGASTYEDKSKNLQYAANDIRDFCNFMQSSGSQVTVDTLFDRQVTLANLRQLRQKLEQTRVDDQVIFYYAGHGMIADDNNYYLAAYNTDFLNPEENSLAYAAIEQLLDGIPAQKKLILMDACHAGELSSGSTTETTISDTVKIARSFRGATLVGPTDSGKNAYSLMKELFMDIRKGTGATVIAAAGGDEYAFEGRSTEGNIITNGIFTHCLLEGLRTKKADSNEDNRITINELQRYISTEVPKLTKGLQNPTFRIENIANDWAIWE
ncbi:caspase family protein [Cyclobacterium plantarum]|uniref:PQQ-binding-like beta-propeller repeat protein n=1 Tax=Cyclobacterium plantarum TaxID=2716263 RepID=A0ABX0HDJ4_9BACT|nr:caspase family protein [Cyclobacterium plantarum]NHE58973.1 PQQ-binding-like beta-propeller repeat protein [Cyclobacterium plantarum]